VTRQPGDLPPVGPVPDAQGGVFSAGDDPTAVLGEDGGAYRSGVHEGVLAPAGGEARVLRLGNPGAERTLPTAAVEQRGSEAQYGDDAMPSADDRVATSARHRPLLLANRLHCCGYTH
jgi:hypothetical protein